MTDKNRPTHILQIRQKGDGKGANRNAGCAFPNKVGGLTIYLNPGVVIDYKTSQEFYINLNPPYEGGKSRGADGDTFGGDPEVDYDEEIPFG